MEVCDVVARGGAAFDEVQVCAFIHDDQRMLELACPLRIQAEVGLERDLHGDALRHIHEGTAGPDSAVERREFVVLRRNKMHEVLADHGLVFRVQSAFEIHVDDALSLHFLADIVVDKLRVVLGADAGQILVLRLRNAQLGERVADLLRHILPLVLHLVVFGADIGRNVIHVETRDIRSPIRHFETVVDLQRTQPEFPHPVGIVFLPGQALYDLCGETRVKAVIVRAVVADIIDTAVYVRDLGLLDIFHFVLVCIVCLFAHNDPYPSKAANPSLPICSIRSAPPSAAIFPSTMT